MEIVFLPAIEGLDAVILGVVAVLLAWAQFAFIEQRYRRPIPRRNWPVVTAILTIAVSISAVSVEAALHKGWRWRIPDERLTVTSSASGSKADCGHFNQEFDRKLITCQNYRGADKDLFVWGDSHAAHLAAGLAGTYPDRNIYIFYSSGCNPQSGFEGYLRKYSSNNATNRCARHNRKAFDFLLAGPPRDIIITSAKRETPMLMAGITMAVMEQLKAKGSTVVFLGDFIRPGVNLVDCVAAPKFIVSDEWLHNRCIGDAETAERELDYNTQLELLVPGFISPNHIQCPDRLCGFFEGTRLLYRDDHHLSELGSRYFVSQLRPILPF